MLFQVTEGTTPQMVKQFKKFPRCIGGKTYYFGTTTHAETGVKDHTKPKYVYLEMREQDLMAQFHGEFPLMIPKMAWIHREARFFRHIAPWLVENLEGLRMSFEHLSTAIGVDFVETAPASVTGGFTIQHAEKTMDDVEGGLLQPDLFCKPHLKDYPDLDRIQQAMLSGSPKFYPSPDSAPHLRRTKLCLDGCAGVLSTPVIPERFLQFYHDHGQPNKAEGFLSTNARNAYKLPIPTKSITFVKKTWDVPESYPTSIEGPGSDLISYLHGQKVTWQIEGQENYYKR